MSIILSVLVPTRNRAEQLRSLLKIFERCESSGVEFLISDNSDFPQTFMCSSPAVRFYRPDSVLNMTANWNYIASKATGKYMTFVGDDDALLPKNLGALVKFLETTDADFVWTRTAGYVWPQGAVPGSFYQEAAIRRKLPNLDLSRKKIMRLELSAELPTPYNSSVFRRELLQNFEQEHPTERFFSSRIPDVNAGAKLMFLARSQEKFESTVFVSGTSSLSNGLLTRSQPSHPRALEFNDISHNPLPSRGGWIQSEVPPFGYITFFEGIQESLFQLGIMSTQQEKFVAFKSVCFSSSPYKQYQISQAMWPQYSKCLFVALVLGTARGFKWIVFLLDKWRKLGVIVRTLLGITSVVSLRGPALPSTADLVDYLEKSEVLKSPAGIIRRTVS